MITKGRNALLAGLLVLALPTAFVSCSSDDDDDVKTVSEDVTPKTIGETFDVGEVRYVITSDNEVCVTQGDSDFNIYIIDKSGGSYSGDIVIPETVTYDGTTYSVKGIFMSAFWGCKNLTSVTIPNSVVEIMGNAFQYCSNLRTVKLGDSVETIGEFAFFECTSLKEITIPESTASIGGAAFINCTSLTTVNFNAVACNTTVDASMFYSCTAISNVNIGENVTEIPNCLFSCYGFENTYTVKPFSFTEITIPNSVTSIGYEAFRNCENLETLTIGENVETIASEAFCGCTSLASITSYNSTPPTCESSSVFSNVDTSACVLYVPAESVEAYSAADQWRAFTNIVGI